MKMLHIIDVSDISMELLQYPFYSSISVTVLSDNDLWPHNFFLLSQSLFLSQVLERERKREANPTMVSSSYLPSTNSFLHPSPTITVSSKSPRNLSILRRPKCVHSSSNQLASSSPSPLQSRALQCLVPVAASVAFLLWSSPVNAGILSGSKGLESIPGPQLPQIDFLNRFNEENQKKYAEFDERFKSNPLLKKYLEKTELNKEKNKKEIQDKYCIRGAEWGVGDCSAEGMSPDERDKFIAMLKEKAGYKD